MDSVCDEEILQFPFRDIITVSADCDSDCPLVESDDQIKIAYKTKQKKTNKGKKKKKSKRVEKEPQKKKLFGVNAKNKHESLLYVLKPCGRSFLENSSVVQERDDISMELHHIQGRKPRGNKKIKQETPHKKEKKVSLKNNSKKSVCKEDKNRKKKSKVKVHLRTLQSDSQDICLEDSQKTIIAKGSMSENTTKTNVEESPIVKSGINTLANDVNSLVTLRQLICKLFSIILPDMPYPDRFHSQTNTVDQLVEEILSVAHEKQRKVHNVRQKRLRVSICADPGACLYHLRRSVCVLVQSLVPGYEFEEEFCNSSTDVESLLRQIISANDDARRY